MEQARRGPIEKVSLLQGEGQSESLLRTFEGLRGQGNRGSAVS